MRWTHRLQGWALLSLPLLVLLICSVTYLIRLGNYLSPRLAPIVAQVAADSLNRQVRVESVDVFGHPGSVTLRDVVISNAPTFAQDRSFPAVSVGQVNVRYNISDLLSHPENAVSCVQDVSLTQPSVYVERLATGKFNFSDLLVSKNPSKSQPFLGKIIVSDGTLVVRDGAAPTSALRAAHTFTKVAGEADLTDATIVSFSASGYGAPQLVHSFLVKGQVLRGHSLGPHAPRSASQHGFGLEVQFVDADLPHFAPYFTSRLSTKINILGGRGQGDIAIKELGAVRTSYKIEGSVSVAGGSVRLVSRNIVDTPISAINGTAQFTQDYVTFNTVAKLSGQEAAVSGTVVGFKVPKLFVQVNSNSLNYERLRRSLVVLPSMPTGVTLSNRIAAQTWITGAMTKPSVDVLAQVPEVTAYGYPLNHVDIDFSYGAKVTVVHSIDVGVGSNSSRLSAAGMIDLSSGKPTYHFYGQARSIYLSDLPVPETLRHSLNPLSASVSGVFDATQSGIQATLSSVDGLVHGIPYAAAEAQLYYHTNSDIDIQHLFIRQPRSGIIVASGTIPVGHSPNPINLQFRAAQLDLSPIGSALTKTPVAGFVYAKGSVTGAPTNAQLSTHLYVLQPRFGLFSANVLTTDISGNEDRMNIGSLVVRDVPASSDATGYVTNLLSKDPGISLSLTYRDLPLSYLNSIKNTKDKVSSPFPITGFISGKAVVSGALGDPAIEASVSLDDGIFQDFQFTNTSADLSYHHKAVTINGVRATIAGVNIAGSGSYNLSGAIALDLNATASDLGILTQRYTPSLQIFGGLQVAATIDGEISNPSVTAVLSTKDVSVEGTKLSITPATFQYWSNDLKMTRGPFIVTEGAAQYLLSSFALDLSSKTVNAHGSEAGETLTQLIATIQKSPYLQNKIGASLNSVLSKMPEAPTGNLNVADFSVDGPIQHPRVDVNASLSQAKVAGQLIDALQVKATVVSTKTSVETFRLTGPNDVFLEASGTVDSSGPVDAKLEASGFNLSLLNPYISQHFPLGGRLSDLTVIATGATRAPELSGSITVDKPSFGALTLDRIDSGEIDVRNNHISVNGLTFTKEESATGGTSIIDHTLTIAGSIPFKWRDGEVLQAEIPSTIPISLTADIPTQSISFINQMLPTLSVKLPTGSIAGHVQVTGTLADKQVNGSFNLMGASIVADGYQTSFKNIDIALSLTGKSFNFTNFSALSSYGGTVGLSGGGQFTGSELLDPNVTASSVLSDLQLSLKVGTNNLVLNERKIALFNNAGVTARINSTLAITGPILRPLINGTVALDKVVGSLPATSASVAPDAGVPKFNPRFDIAVKIDPEAQLKTAQLNAQADGNVTLAGSLYRPRIDGTFLIRKGEFYFPTATFKVVPVGTVDFHFHPPLDISEDIQMTATTTISVSPDLIARNPAGANTTSTYVPPSLTTTASSASQRYSVTVNINGDLVSPDRLHLTFQSDPPGLTDAQILAVLGGQQAIAGLTGGNIVTALQTQVASVFNASVVPKMLQPLEDTIGTVLGLEDFSINYAPESPVQVTIVKRLGSRLSVQYTQSVNPRQPSAVSSTLEPPEYQVKLGYSFTPRLQATISTDDQNNNIVAIEGVHNF